MFHCTLVRADKLLQIADLGLPGVMSTILPVVDTKHVFHDAEHNASCMNSDPVYVG